MIPEVSGTLLFVIFETSLILSSFRLQYLFCKKIKKNIDDSERIITWIAINLTLTIIIASVFSFLQFNGIAQYIIASFGVLAILHYDKKSNLIFYFSNLNTTLTKISRKIFTWKIIIMFFLILPLIISIIRPLENYDSLLFWNYIVDWALNESTPYERAWSFVPIWELSYLPSMIITKSDNFFWINSIKSLIIIALGTYLIGRQIRIPKNLAVLVAFSGILFFVYWQVGVEPEIIGLGGGTHVGSLKNYHFVASGMILIALSILRIIKSDFDRLSGVILVLGIIFTTTKYAGVLITIISLTLLVIFHRQKILHYKKRILFWGVIGTVFIISLTGHYYLENLIDHQNPFYPLKIKFLGYELPGNIDWSNTSIVSNLEDNRVIQILFPVTQISKAGLLFPVIFSFGLVGPVGIIFYQILNYKKKRELDSHIIFLSIFIFFNWILFLITPLSAGRFLSDLQYLQTLISLQYAEAILILTELLFIYFLIRIGIPKNILLLVVGINLVSRIFLLYSQLPEYIDYFILVYPIAIIIGIKIFLPLLKRKRIIIFIIFGVLVGISSPYIYDEHRKMGWAQPYYDEVIKEINDMEPKKIILLNRENIFLPYYFIGNNNQHSVTMISEHKFNQMMEEGKNFDADYVINYCRPARMNCETQLGEFESYVKRHGFTKEAFDENVNLFKIPK